ncbi:MAG TPA: NADH-quinone oxidoreductase subunit NuoH [Polyangia bacterium]
MIARRALATISLLCGGCLGFALLMAPGTARAQANPSAAGTDYQRITALLGAPGTPDDFIRDVRPTVLAPDDTLVIECPGVRPDEPAQVTLLGQRSGDRGSLRYEGVGQGARGDRVLLNLPPPRAPTRLVGVALEVTQGTRRWRLAPGHVVSLQLSAPSLETAARGLATSIGLSGPAAALIALALLVTVALLVHLLVAPVTGLVVVWERKIWARMQSRIGPNRVGPAGWLQWLADGVKMLLKEDTIPRDADTALFRFAPYIMWSGVFATFVLLPLSAHAIIADLDVGLLFLTSITSLTVIGILLGGWTSNSKWSLLGGMRSAAQIVSYELPAAMALLQIALLAGTLSPQGIVRAQGGLPHQWFVFASPLAFAGFFIYFIAALAEGNRTPFDLPEAESELVAGFTTEYSGFRYGVFMLAEWTNVYVLSAIAAALFLGGWNIPFVSADAVAGSWALGVLGGLVMLTKVVALVFVIIWIRATLPRFRLDQLMALCWKYLIPLSFAAFVFAAAWLLVCERFPQADFWARLVTFAFGGLGLAGLFVVRVLANLRGSHLLPPPRGQAP